MSTVTKNKSAIAKSLAGVPWGNAATIPLNLTTNAAGAAVDSNLATALQIADVVRLGILPAGLTLHDAQLIISDAFTAATTAGVGFSYVDGVDSATVPQDAAYFVAAASLALNATGISRKTSVTAPVTLPKDAYLILTLAGAAHASVGVLDVIVHGVHTGAN